MLNNKKGLSFYVKALLVSSLIMGIFFTILTEALKPTKESECKKIKYDIIKVCLLSKNLSKITLKNDMEKKLKIMINANTNVVIPPLKTVTYKISSEEIRIIPIVHLDMDEYCELQAKVVKAEKKC